MVSMRWAGREAGVRRDIARPLWILETMQAQGSTSALWVWKATTTQHQESFQNLPSHFWRAWRPTSRHFTLGSGYLLYWLKSSAIKQGPCSHYSCAESGLHPFLIPFQVAGWGTWSIKADIWSFAHALTAAAKSQKNGLSNEMQRVMISFFCKAHWPIGP